MLVDVLSATLRALSFIALFQAAGAVLFIALFGAGVPASHALIRRLGSLAALAAMVLVMAHYALEPARMGGELAGMLDGSLWQLVVGSGSTKAVVLRALGLALIAVGLQFAKPDDSAVAAVGIDPRAAGRAGPVIGLGVGLAGVALTLVAFTFVGHTVEHSQRALLDVALVAHLLVVAFWFGGLVPLFLVSLHEQTDAIARVVGRYSAWATWTVPGLFLAGLALSVALLGSVQELASPYGQLLLYKLCGFAATLILASLNKWRFVPALSRGDTNARASLRKALVGELVLIATVLIATAVMTTFFSPEVP